jgi:hypothetical protein
MAHYAFLDQDNIVVDIIVGIDETELIEGLDPETWYGNFRGKVCKRTSYNTIANSHILGGTPFRKNYAQVGYIYNEELDAFIPPKTLPSFILDEQTFTWKPPLPYPEGENRYVWNEESISWELHTES